ncbi:hypothetical protein RJT34_00659 [Clitoria ternatea]|uniref:Uncharacterized protein n=1 Tax=Clitoria ternatea TaxID=43366 RepID=A0AAN9Q0S2_CLITE
MEHVMVKAEDLISYKFKNKKLLLEAFTNSSFPDAVSYKWLKFMGVPTLSCMISNHLFLAYPTLDPGQLSLLHAVNISTKKLSRVAIRHRPHLFIRHRSPSLLKSVKAFVDAVTQENPLRSRKLECSPHQVPTFPLHTTFTLQNVQNKNSRIVSKNGWILPEYHTKREGPEHNSCFTSVVTANGFTFFSLSATHTSKLAQNDTARLALEYFSPSEFNPPTLNSLPVYVVSSFP